MRRSSGVAIIDSQVHNFATGESIGLSKDDFAELIANDDPNFQDVEFGEFSKIFDVIATILRES
jgi:hypothetical protein